MKLYYSKTTEECIKIGASLVNLDKNLDSKPCYVFCEDKITLNTELEIAKKMGGFIGVEVLTFKRYIKSKMPNVNMLSKESSVMVVRKIISELKDKLQCFNASLNNPNLAVTIYELISQIKSAKISVCDLLKLNESSISLSLALKKKILDIGLIYSEYENYLEKNGLLDSNNYLSLIVDLLYKDESISNAQIILIGFPSITKQRLEIFKTLENRSNNVSIVTLADATSEIYTNEVVNVLKRENLITKEIETPFNYSSEVLKIKDNLFNPKVFSDNFKGEESKNVLIFEAVSQKSEVEFVAKKIIKDVKEGARFKDMAIAVGSLNAYYPIITSVFKEYNIPYFIDRKVTLSSHPIYLYVMNYLDLLRKGFAPQDVLRFCSSSLLCSDKGLTDGFKNYVLKYAGTRSLIKKPFTTEAPNLSQYEKIRELVYSVYLKGEKAKTVKDYVYAIKQMIEDTNAFENVNGLSNSLISINELELVNLNKGVKDKILGVFNEMEVVLGDVEINNLDFKTIFSSGANGLEISSIPLFHDAVFIGECKDVKIKNANVLYAMGLNGEIPFSKSDTAILTDSDLYELDGFQVMVDPKVKAVNLREKENVGVMLMSFNKELVVSFADTSVSGAPLFKSEAIDYLSRIFNIEPLKENTLSALELRKGDISYENFLIGFANPKTAKKEIAKHVVKAKSGDGESKYVLASILNSGETEVINEYKNIIENFFNEEDNKHLDSEYNFYFPDNYAYTSAIEKYFDCPYKAYVQNLLNLKDVETGDVKVYEMGNLLHKVIENYVNRLKLDNGENTDSKKVVITDKNSSDKLVKEVISEILTEEKYSRFLNAPQKEFFSSNIERESKRVCYNVYLSIVNSKFNNVKTEVEFKDGKGFNPLKLQTKFGEYKLTGKIDRLDVYDNNFRIIDYKTGTIDNSAAAFYSGRKLQLYLYLNAIKESTNLTPVGTYYYPVHDKFLDKTEKSYTMLGSTLNAEEIVYATDVNIQKGGSSEYAKVAIKKGGGVNGKSQVLTSVELSKYMEYAKKVASQGIEEMKIGNISPSPYENSCNYCDYKSLCGYGSDACRKVLNIDKKTFVNAVNNDTDIKGDM